MAAPHHNPPITKTIAKAPRRPRARRQQNPLLVGGAPLCPPAPALAAKAGLVGTDSSWLRGPDGKPARVIKSTPKSVAYYLKRFNPWLTPNLLTELTRLKHHMAPAWMDYVALAEALHYLVSVADSWHPTLPLDSVPQRKYTLKVALDKIERGQWFSVVPALIPDSGSDGPRKRLYAVDYLELRQRMQVLVNGLLAMHPVAPAFKVPPAVAAGFALTPEQMFIEERSKLLSMHKDDFLCPRRFFPYDAEYQISQAWLPSPLLTLPHDVWIGVAGHLGIVDLLRFATTCKLAWGIAVAMDATPPGLHISATDLRFPSTRRVYSHGWYDANNPEDAQRLLHQVPTLRYYTGRGIVEHTLRGLVCRRSTNRDAVRFSVGYTGLQCLQSPLLTLFKTFRSNDYSRMYLCTGCHYRFNENFSRRTMRRPSRFCKYCTRARAIFMGIRIQQFYQVPEDACLSAKEWARKNPASPLDVCMILLGELKKKAVAKLYPTPLLSRQMALLMSNLDVSDMTRPWPALMAEMEAHGAARIEHFHKVLICEAVLGVVYIPKDQIAVTYQKARQKLLLEVVGRRAQQFSSGLAIRAITFTDLDCPYGSEHAMAPVLAEINREIDLAHPTLRESVVSPIIIDE